LRTETDNRVLQIVLLKI